MNYWRNCSLVELEYSIQFQFNWKQTGKSTLAGGAAGFVMGGAMGMFSLTSAGQAFGKWMSEPTKLEQNAMTVIKQALGNNRGSVSLGKEGSNTVNPKDVNFMQSSIKNQMGEYTVLENAEALKNGTLQATDLPEIRIWQDADGKLWTLDHRRLAAFRIAELDSVPFRWAIDEEIAGQMWKMTTKTNGTSIKLKLGNGENMTIQ